MKKKVYVMMSGGVDSSVAASVLKDQGYDVFGIYMKCWSLDQLDIMGLSHSLYACSWEDDIIDARLVAKKLDIPFEVWDLQEQYRKNVIEYMIGEYKIGLTPNPDVMCNSTIKFGVFYDKAMKEGADFVATGHYARIIENNGKKLIARGKDDNKDQSYFLWKIQQSEIEKILFPVGEFDSKTEVRKYALEKDLITADKKDSQGLCFVGKTSLRDLLLESLGEKDGDIIDTSGKVLGRHKGAFLYTIGQREKLGLSGGPWFVSKIDVEKNIVEVTHKDNEQDTLGRVLLAKNLNWLVDIDGYTEGGDLLRCQAQIRYRQEAENCVAQIVDAGLKVIFDQPVKAIAKGQSVVFYLGEVLVGGGVIS